MKIHIKYALIACCLLPALTFARNLLETNDRGSIHWNQSTNNNGSCITRYNKHIPVIGRVFEEQCLCTNSNVGCGAVAMGQAMWYWQCPRQSIYRTYDWSNMPNALYDNTPVQQEDNIAHFLHDCGVACNMNYDFCDGSWTLISYIANALQTKFGYTTCEVLTRSDWSDDVWIKIMKTEIDAGRPIIYTGFPDNAINFPEGHFFNVDGYIMENGQPKFHLNYGHGGGDDTDAFLSNFEYQYQNNMIIGISPTRTYNSNIPCELTSFLFNTVISQANFSAYNLISLPAPNRSLTIKSGAVASMTAGRYITLEKGFKVEKGGSLSTSIDRSMSILCDCGLSTAGLPWLSRTSAGYEIHGANSFLFTVYDTSGRLVYANAGLVTSNFPVVWTNPINYVSTGTYVLQVTFRNNCGQKVTRSDTMGLY
ncbi:MAG: hypothetical protein EOL95_11275 [Bacteroidia bacterium]|nr:hypothetical protein [Bacteroidia bacterium]